MLAQAGGVNDGLFLEVVVYSVAVGVALILALLARDWIVSLPKLCRRHGKDPTFWAIYLLLGLACLGAGLFMWRFLFGGGFGQWYRGFSLP